MFLLVILTSIHRSQMEQCEQRGGRNILHVRQYLISASPEKNSID